MNKLTFSKKNFKIKNAFARLDTPKIFRYNVPTVLCDNGNDNGNDNDIIVILDRIILLSIVCPEKRTI